MNQTRKIAPATDSQIIDGWDANVRPPSGPAPWGYHSPMTRCWAPGRGLLLAGFVTVLATAACEGPRDSIIVDEGMVMVENQTPREWRKVRVTVNDHFSGGVDVLLPGGRLNAPLSQFQTGLGQKFDRGRQSVFKVEVTATEPDGTPVTLKWDPPRR